MKTEALTPEQTTKQEHKQHLDNWVSLMRNPFWEYNVNYIKDRIKRLENELQKIATKNNLDNAIAGMALMRSIDEFKKLLSHYEIVVKEKIRYDSDVITEIHKQEKE